VIRGNERAIDLGLAVLASISRTGQRHTLDQLADVCEEARKVLKCSQNPITRQDFWFLEHRALVKLQRAAVRRMRHLGTDLRPIGSNVTLVPVHRVHREKIAA
jgi:hypothetical protein